MIDSIIQDIKYGFRSMAKNRGFAAVAVITLRAVMIARHGG